MKKRGQGGEVIRYIIIAAIIVIITFFGFKGYTAIKERTCKAELAKFHSDLENLDKEVRYGDVKEFAKQVPCDVDKIYFFDLGKDINPGLLEDMPLIKDSIQSNVKENIFVMKNNNILDSFYAGNLDIAYPDHICFLPRSGKINFFLEGKGSSVSVVSGCLQPECTYFPDKAEDVGAARIINEAVEFGTNNIGQNQGQCKPEHCPTEATKTDAWNNFYQTKQNIQILRKFDYCKETGKTAVEITIKPIGNAELQQFRFYEYIQKECVQQVSDELVNYLKGQYAADVSIKADPLIIWSLGDVRQEQKLSYFLNTILDDECRKAIKGIGIAETIGNGIPVANIPQMPIITAPQQQPTSLALNLDDNVPYRQKISDFDYVIYNHADLLGYTTYTGNKDALEYDVIYQSNSGLIDCDIDNLIQLRCIINVPATVGTSDVIIEVTDGTLTALDTVLIDVVEFGTTGTGGLTCTDGTPSGQCSTTRPNYCNNGNLIPSCGPPYNCGCPTGQVCDVNTGLCGTI